MPETPVFMPPDVDWVECFGCGEVTDVEHVADAVDVSPDDEYYPDMRPLCRGCADE